MLIAAAADIAEGMFGRPAAASRRKRARALFSPRAAPMGTPIALWEPRVFEVAIRPVQLVGAPR